MKVALRNKSIIYKSLGHINFVVTGEISSSRLLMTALQYVNLLRQVMQDNLLNFLSLFTTNEIMNFSWNLQRG